MPPNGPQAIPWESDRHAHRLRAFLQTTGLSILRPRRLFSGLPFVEGAGPASAFWLVCAVALVAADTATVYIVHATTPSLYQRVDPLSAPRLGWMAAASLGQHLVQWCWYLALWWAWLRVLGQRERLAKLVPALAYAYPLHVLAWGSAMLLSAASAWVRRALSIDTSAWPDPHSALGMFAHLGSVAWQALAVAGLTRRSLRWSLVAGGVIYGAARLPSLVAAWVL